MKNKIKHINPGNGLGELLFGLDKSQVKKIIGKADRIFNEEVEKGYLVEVWEYDELGLSLRFDGKEVMELTSLSIISSFYEYNGVKLIGKSLKEVREALQDVEYQIYTEKSQKEKVIFSKELSLVITFVYDTATSISWDPSEMNPSYARILKKYGLKKSRRNSKKRNAKRKSKESTVISKSFKPQVKQPVQVSNPFKRLLDSIGKTLEADKYLFVFIYCIILSCLIGLFYLAFVGYMWAYFIALLIFIFFVATFSNE